MIEDIFNLLRKDIQSKIGHKILHGKECVQLSRQIYTETHRQISDSTLKRFFGLVKTQFNPSKYTLETLAVFLGFNDWTDYLNCYDEKRFSMSKSDSWDILKRRINLVTDYSLDSLKLKTAYNPDKLIFRSFVQKKISEFANSTKTATMFIAPDGYGKSTLLIQILEKYFLAENSIYKDDIVALIDGGIFFNLYSRNPNIDLLSQILDFKISSSFVYFFHNNPEKRKGRIWVLIDNVDEIFFDKESYHKLAENLVRIVMANDFGWYKMILTCRPENLNVFTYVINKNPLLKSCWYDVNFKDYELTNVVNIPPFSTREIVRILNRHQFRFSYKEMMEKNREVFKIIHDPYLLSIFVEEFRKNEKVSAITLLNRFIERRLYSPPYQEEKLLLINTFMELCKWGKGANTVKKEKLLSMADFSGAYKELISYGIIYEYFIPTQLVSSTAFVKFNHNAVFEYFLFEKWRQSSGLTLELFFKIREYYKSNIQLQCNLLKFMALFLLHEKQFELIKQLHLELESQIQIAQSETPPCLISFVSVIKHALQTNIQVRNNLGHWLSHSKLNKLYTSEQM